MPALCAGNERNTMNIAERQAEADAALVTSRAQAEIIARLEAQVEHLEHHLLAVALADVQGMNADLRALIALFNG